MTQDTQDNRDISAVAFATKLLGAYTQKPNNAELWRKGIADLILQYPVSDHDPMLKLILEKSEKLPSVAQCLVIFNNANYLKEAPADTMQIEGYRAVTHKENIEMRQRELKKLQKGEYDNLPEERRDALIERWNLSPDWFMRKQHLSLQ